MNTDDIRKDIIGKSRSWLEARLLEVLDEIDRLEKENNILCAPFCGECGEAIGGSTFNSEHRYKIAVGCGCREQRTTQRIRDNLGKLWNETEGHGPISFDAIDEAIDSVEGK